MIVIAGGIGSDGALVAPTMIFDMTIRERNVTSTVMSAAGPVEKIIFGHINAKVRPANAVGMDVHKEKQAVWHISDGFRMFSKNFVSGPVIAIERTNSVIPFTDVADVNVE